MNNQQVDIFAILNNNIANVSNKIDILTAMVDAMIEVYDSILEATPDETGQVRSFSYRINQGMAKRQLFRLLTIAKNNRSQDLSVASNLQSQISSLKQQIVDTFGRVFLDELEELYNKLTEHVGGEDKKWQGIVKV